MKFHALNESSTSGDEGENTDLATKEAQEEEAYGMYNTALKCHSQGDLALSEETFKKLLELDFITQVHPQDESEEKGPLRPALNLKYLVLKNLAVIAKKREDYNGSISCYLDALDIDSSDINMWYHVGITSLKVPNYSLSRLCFEEGLKRNANHWPSLDNVIDVTYALNDYANCLYYISKALEKEPLYLKGLIVKDQIFKENPSLKSFCEGYFDKCDPVIHCSQYDEEEATEVIQSALALREKNQSLYKSPEPPVLKLNVSIKEFTWKSVGESIVLMYEHIATSEVFISLTSKIDLSDYLDLEKSKIMSSEMEVDGLLITADVKQCKNSSVRTPALQESSAEKEDDSPSTSDMSLISSSFLETLAETDLRTPDPLIYSDAPLGNRKPPKRKRSLLSELSELCGKRRSTRVRNPVLKRPHDNVNYQEILQQFLPPKLVGDSNYDDQDDSDTCQSRNANDHNYGQSAESSKNGSQKENVKDCEAFLSTEKEEMERFLVSSQENGGLMDLLYKYVTMLGGKSNIIWPKMLPDVFSAAFMRLRKHITMPNLFCSDTEKNFTKEIGFAVLAFSELKVDQWYLSTGHSTSSSLSFSPRMPANSSSFQIGPDSIGKNFHADVEFLMQLTVRRDVLEDDWLDFTIRALWLKAKFHSVEGEVDLAVACMEKLSDVLQRECQPDAKIVVANSYFSNIVTLETVQQQLESLQRCQSLEEIQRLYETGAYQAVVDLLVVTFGQTHSKPKISGDNGIPERHVQLMLLQDSLWKLEKHSECIKWTEVAFKESIQQFMNASGSTAKNDWVDTITHLLSGLERCVKIDTGLVSVLEDSKLVRLTQNLILVICLQMETYDISLDSSLTVLPWMILYRLIQNEEIREKTDRIRKLQAKSIDLEPATKIQKLDPVLLNSEIETCMPSSLLLLITAHECFGRRSCCCVSDGLFLLQCVDFFMEKLRGNSIRIQSYREDLENAIEQTFYCLYGHPHKRTKAKHLQEHNAPQITLTWERALPVYQYFTPNILPEFDSYRTSTVSAELENLLKRIITLVPAELDPSSRVDAYTAYIEGGTDEFPKFSDVVPDNMKVFRDLYYLLGDYYFKNKEFSKAIRYYLLDVCINRDRLDSWAGMALSRSSQLDQKLNSYEVRNESTIWRKSSATLRCFEHALELNASTNSLWIEYGSLAYMLHSHASRQLKLNTYFDGPRDLLKVKKDEMLSLAERCFKEANKSDDDTVPEEAWLHHYMLGKIAQKVGRPPSVFLSHYLKSLSYLHDDEARYPHKIQYHNPPELSIEVLEVYYRIHASSLKFLCKYETSGLSFKELKIIEDSLDEVTKSPFALFQEKIKVEESVSGSECDIDESSNQLDNLPKTVIDHNYYNKTMDHETPDPGIPVENPASPIEESKSEPSKDVHDAVDDLLNAVLSHMNQNPIDAISTDTAKQVTNIEIVADDIKDTSPPDQTMKENDSPSTKIQAEAFDDITEDLPANVNNVNAETDVKIFDSICNSEMNDIVTTLNDVINDVLKSVACARHSSNNASDSQSSPKTDIPALIHENSSIQKDENKLNSPPSQDQMDCDKSSSVNDLCVLNMKDSESPLSVKKVPDPLPISQPSTSQQNSGDNVEATSEEELKLSTVKINELIVICLNGLRECLKRFIQHYKALYRIAYYYCNSHNNQNFQWAREVLLAATPAVKNYPPMPGLFAERKNTNFFNGIWRAPSNEIDRPGSFDAHMHRSVCLLIDVLSKQNDYNMLLYLTQQLYRTPDLGKKYMRDSERVSLARQAYDGCVMILREQMNSLLQEEPPPEESRLTCCLLEIYRTFQALMKGAIFVDDTNELLEEAYTMYKLGEVDPYPAVLEQAVLFCQMQLGKSYQINHEGNRFSSPKQSSAVGDTDSSAKTPTTPVGYYTPDAWQREFAKSFMLPKTPAETRSDAKLLQESLILIPVDKDVSKLMQLPSSSHSTEMANLGSSQGCSLTVLPIASVLPTSGNIPSANILSNAMLSRQAYNCYDILESMMQASGYQVLPKTPTSKAARTFVKTPPHGCKRNEESK